MGEKRSIKVVHRKSGDEYEFSTRTAWYGHWKKKAGGYLAEWNSTKSEDHQRSADEFDITDIQTPEPIHQCLHTMKRTIMGYKEALGADSYYGYSGKGVVFREDVSTVLKYKGNREGALRPFHLESLKEYLVKHHACEIVTGIEADDACSIDCYTAWHKWRKEPTDENLLALAYVDKDYLQCAGHLYNTNYLDGLDSYDGFGWLRMERVGKEVKPKGRGRLWLYFQVMSEDTSDNYCANAASDMKWGVTSAFNLLKDCKTDKEAFEAMVKGYKLLYPAPKTIVGWRGYEDPKTRLILKPDHKDFEVDVDWLSMLQENFTLAKMLRWRGDYTDVTKVMDNLGVER